VDLATPVDECFQQARHHAGRRAWVASAAVNSAGPNIRGIPQMSEICPTQACERSDETAHEFLKDVSLPDLLMRHVAERPDSPAVTYRDERLTYRELADLGTMLAAHLRHLGVARDDCVGLFVEPSITAMVGAWGILFSGGAYLPLSPEYPVERLRYMIEDSGMKVIFTQEELEPRLTELAPQGTMIATLPGAVAFTKSHGKPRLGDGPRPESLAYAIYTSGSTGRPKGVMIEHRSVVNQMHWLSIVHGLGADKVVLQKTPLSFDAAQWEILAVCCGSTVVMGDPGIYRDPERVIDAIVAHDVTTLQCVPTLLQALLDTEEMHRCTSLTQIFSGGEALSRALARACVDALPDCTLVNLYGPAECTINSSAFTVGRSTVSNGPNAVSIGGPVYNTCYHILDDRRSPVAVGEVGELYIGGVQLARGYLHRPDLTAERFVPVRHCENTYDARLFKTGDLAYWNADGTVQFVGRADNQVKLRGVRVELDEIRLAIETHDWVKNAAVVVKNDPHTGFQNLIACVELNPKEAALMDQGNHGAHHQSKESRLQVRVQLSNPGCRDAEDLRGRVAVDLPGKVAAPAQRRQAFERKTYRFYEGGEVRAADLLWLLGGGRVTGDGSRGLDHLHMAEFGEILRYFGQHLSDERLLPKYGYASPGSLYATQLYIELSGIGGLRSGCYYYHPVHHQLVLIRETAGGAKAEVKAHFIGRKRAIEPVYRNNIQEVLEIETGHMVGLFEQVLPGYGLDIAPSRYAPAIKDALECADEDYYLGTFDVVPYGTALWPADPVDIYVQAHPGKIADLPAGHYQYRDDRLERISDELVLKKHVIAINQEVYTRASFGITVVSRERQGWLAYIHLGRTLQHLSMNDLGLGFMSSGYSSKTGADLPSAKRIESILRSTGRATGPSYFFFGGRVSAQQRSSEGMKEDVVHMKGPTEMIRDDLITFLPEYMIPNKVVVFDQLPLTANGKIDSRALVESDQTNVDRGDRPLVTPRTPTERRIGKIWKKAMKRDAVSTQDDFFATGGNSLIAVGLVNRINREFGCSLPLQVLFDAPTIAKLALMIDGQDGAPPISRLVRLRTGGSKSPVYCWPGLGGYPMNLRQLAAAVDVDRPFYGVQAYGINPGETPYRTIREMAAADVEAIRQLQPAGPYTLWGYSFGARVAFESAYQLERSGERVENLFLIAPGSPKVSAQNGSTHAGECTYDNPVFVTILFSVFAGSITGPQLRRCLEVAGDQESFASFVCQELGNLDRDLVRRIIRIVTETFQFKYTFDELVQRRIEAPITIFKAVGDDYSFIENCGGYSATVPTVIHLDADHYSMLRKPDIDELVTIIHRRTGESESYFRQEATVPHVNIKHFPARLSEQQTAELVASLTAAVTNAFGCPDSVVSIALEPVEREAWNDQVYVPEIVNRKNLLCKSPNY
jgi:amino acid adenylation domain-containing protein